MQEDIARLRYACGDIAFDRLGEGPPIILVGGATTTRADCMPLAAILAAHFTVLSPDRRGRGESGDTLPYAVAREVEDIDALITAAGGSAFVFGHSSEAFAGTPFEADYLRLAPNPNDFPTLVAKLTALDTEVQDWPAEKIRAITAPAMVIIGDSDVIRPEHAVELFRLLDGGVAGDLVGVPNARLAVLPGTTHLTVMEQTDLLLAIVPPLLDAPMPEGT